ncbi:MAG: FAD-dependent oxidoreductase [Chloroflexi bacterium]|nr:FAD-dependent oxidoreductase [Chloroflexota bacterium]
MKRVVTVGGGLAGCAAAITAAKAGVESIVIERMDSLSGSGPLTGHLTHYIVRMESEALGGGAMEIDHGLKTLAFGPQMEYGRPISHIFDATRIETKVEETVRTFGIQVMLRSRVVDVVKENGRVVGVALEDGKLVEGDAFVDATGTTGGVGVCTQWGTGCAGCFNKCTIFGDPVRVSEAAGIQDMGHAKGEYYSCIYLHPDSVDPKLLEDIRQKQVVHYQYPVPEEWQEHPLAKYWPRPERSVRSNLGPHRSVYLMPFVKFFYQTIPLDILRRLPGLENAWLISPLTAYGNCVKLSSYAPHDLSMRVTGLSNLFAAGLRAGNYSAFAEVMFTADLAGHNAARTALGVTPLVTIPKTVMMGFFLAEINQGQALSDWPPGRFKTHDPRYFELGLDAIEEDAIKQRVREAGLENVFAQKLT